MEVYAWDGQLLSLKEPALGSGGEGDVFEIVGYSDYVAKKYHSLSDAKTKESKIKEMVKLARSNSFNFKAIEDNVAWPVFPLFDKSRNFIGFGMNKIKTKFELDDLYVYPAKENAKVSISDKLKCLKSLCDVVDSLHSNGQVVGDLNPNNIKIFSDYSVVLVDTDSCHIKSSGKTYRCIVCAPGYVAPEIIKKCHGTTYANCPGETFTKESDYFALAIHCFRMLNNGAHPYSCRKVANNRGSVAAPKPLDRRVEKGEILFFKKVSGFAVPDYVPDIDSLPPYIKRLFERAFVDGHNNPSLRPNAKDWKKALIQYESELVRCKSNKQHYYWKNVKCCPYCEADRRSKNMFSPVKRGTTNTFTTGNNATHSNSYANNTVNNASAFAGTTAKESTKYSIMWFVTIVLSLICQVVLAKTLFYDLYMESIGTEWVVNIGAVGGIIVGVVGTGIYNYNWCSYKVNKKVRVYDYILSLLIGLLFSVIFAPIYMGLVYLIAWLIAIIGTVLIVAGCVCLVIAFFSNC